MRIKETKVYQFDELSASAKEKARDWFREFESENFADFAADSVIDDAVTIAKILGIELKQREVKTVGGKVRYEPCIYWEGFSTQGSGANFEGRYVGAPDGVQKLSEHIGNTSDGDKTLRRIASGLAEIQSRYGWRASLSITTSGNYSHSHSMRFEDCAWDDADLPEMSQADAEALADLLRQFANWIYSQLESEYAYRMEDEQIEDGIRANEYEFTEDGKRA